jgi:Protein of unknown function (DUF3108)
MKNLLKKSFLFGCLTPVLVVMMSFTDTNQQPSVTTPQYETPSSSVSMPVDNSAFQSGEELVYKIYYNLNFIWVPAGEVTFKIDDTGGQYHLAATGRTYDSYEWFFKVRDNYDTYVDKATMLPNLSIREVNEGKYRLYDKVKYDQVSKKATFERGNNKYAIDKKGEVNLSESMHDVLSIVYYSRTLNYDNAQMGQEYPIKLMLDEEIYPLKYKFLGKENKKIRDQGTWSTIKFTPRVVSGNVFKEGTEMKIWASNDANKIPLMIESPVSVGSVKIVLKSWKGLKYDVTAKKD